jgi:hypothetical protein
MTELLRHLFRRKNHVAPSLFLALTAAPSTTRTLRRPIMAGVTFRYIVILEASCSNELPSFYLFSSIFTTSACRKHGSFLQHKVLHTAIVL